MKIWLVRFEPLSGRAVDGPPIGATGIAYHADGHWDPDSPEYRVFLFEWDDDPERGATYRVAPDDLVFDSYADHDPHHCEACGAALDGGEAVAGLCDDCAISDGSGTSEAFEIAPA